MNILPKKSWHVRTKKNIERVQRDEAEAERLARIEQDRILNVEHEVRMRELRVRAGIPEPAEKNFNLFEGYQDQQQTTNKDCEDEKRQNQAKLQKSLGIFNKLVRSEDANKPWYCNSISTINPKLDSLELSKQPLSKYDKESSKSDLITSIYDPMTAIKEAEEIVRLKRSKQRMLEFSKTKDINRIDQRMTRRNEQLIKQQKTSADLDSSPEIIRVIEPINSTKRKKYKKKSHKSDKKRKKSHKHKKTHKHNK